MGKNSRNTHKNWSGWLLFKYSSELFTGTQVEQPRMAFVSFVDFVYFFSFLKFLMNPVTACSSSGFLWNEDSPSLTQWLCQKLLLLEVLRVLSCTGSVACLLTSLCRPERLLVFQQLNVSRLSLYSLLSSCCAINWTLTLTVMISARFCSFWGWTVGLVQHMSGKTF